MEFKDFIAWCKDWAYQNELKCSCKNYGSKYYCHFSDGDSAVANPDLSIITLRVGETNYCGRHSWNHTYRINLWDDFTTIMTGA